MKKIIILTVILAGGLAAIFSCKKKEPETVIVKQERGYVCENFTCKFVETGAKYVTLLDCKSDCADTRTGSLTVNARYSGSSSDAHYEFIGISATAEDMAIGAYITSKNNTHFFSAPDQRMFSLTASDLPPGKYYYTVQVRYSSYYLIMKTGFVEVKPVEAKTVDVVPGN